MSAPTEAQQAEALAILKAETAKLGNVVEWCGILGESLCAVGVRDEQATPYIWAPPEFGPSFEWWVPHSKELRADIFAAWGLHMRAIAKAERELRMAEVGLCIKATKRGVCGLLALEGGCQNARLKLRKLGVEP